MTGRHGRTAHALWALALLLCPDALPAASEVADAVEQREDARLQALPSWQAVDYADGLVRVGVQSAIAHPDTAALLRKLMQARGLAVPAEGRTLASICVTDLCQ